MVMHSAEKKGYYRRASKIKCLYGSSPGIEPGTSTTLKWNHTPRPTGHFTLVRQEDLTIKKCLYIVVSLVFCLDFLLA